MFIPTRRQFLQRTSLGFGALALADLMRHESVADAPESQRQGTPSTKPSARHVIFLFMQGGPSHLETFDNKPLLAKYDGKVLPKELQDIDLAQINAADSPVMAPQFLFRRFGQSGQEISSLFPHLSQHADKLAIVRSVYHDLFIHGPAMVMMHSGTSLLGHPSIGAWVTYGLGCESDNLPAYVAMTDSMFRNGASMYSSGFLPAVYQGTDMRVDGVPIQNLTRPPGITGARAKKWDKMA